MCYTYTLRGCGLLHLQGTSARVTKSKGTNPNPNPTYPTKSNPNPNPAMSDCYTQAVFGSAEVRCGY